MKYTLSNAILKWRKGTPSNRPILAPEIGDHLSSFRRWGSLVPFFHHGIYVGNDKVIHYNGLANGKVGGLVICETLYEFSNCNIGDVTVISHQNRLHSREESVERANIRLSEERYHPVYNNCEQFVNWCITGQPTSQQVKIAVGAAIGLISIFAAFGAAAVGGRTKR